MVKMNPVPLYQYLSLPILLNDSVSGPLMFVESREDNDLLMIGTETQREVELKTPFLAGSNVACPKHLCSSGWRQQTPLYHKRQGLFKKNLAHGTRDQPNPHWGGPILYYFSGTSAATY